ncbi:hypothetical protein RJT34_20435 [Clitoria ternatea]|uniref:RING-CH-type domain-containing protein n=1 Tax=Clitoria ternatea TaxID=43366 RepID=A0AAN9IST9_CLITE
MYPQRRQGIVTKAWSCIYTLTANPSIYHSHLRKTSHRLLDDGFLRFFNSDILPPSSVVTEIDLEAVSIEQIQCRIFLETDGRDFIASCRCKGTSKCAHQECLGHWRVVKARCFSIRQGTSAGPLLCFTAKICFLTALVRFFIILLVASERR